MRIAITVVLIAHGFAHLVGVAGSWRLSSSIPYHTSLFRGRIEIGDGGMRMLGALWLLTALAFATAAFGAFTDAPWWRPMTLAITGVSLVLSVAEWPAARIGVAVNVGLVVATLLAR